MVLLVGNAVRALTSTGPFATALGRSAKWDAKRCSSNDMFARVGVFCELAGTLRSPIWDLQPNFYQSILASVHDIETEGGGQFHA